VFGSNFFANFGIPEFPYQGVDAQGGALATNLPAAGVGTNPSQNAAPPPTAPQPPGSASSPLAPGPLAMGGGMTQQPTSTQQPDATAPAAGVGSQFGKPANG
jgi:hypothetical protein